MDNISTGTGTIPPSNVFLKNADAEDLKNVEEIKAEILEKLAHKGAGGFWIWHIFILCFIPGILNGLHVSSYVFIGQLPEDFYCLIPELEIGGWTHQEIRNISTMFKGDLMTVYGCGILDLDYEKLSEMTYSDGLAYVNGLAQQPEVIPCLSYNENYYHFDQKEGISIVPEWNLVCENSVLRTEAQSSLALGKLIGAFVFGIVADKYGRKMSMVISCVIYIICGPVAAVVPWYTAFIFARIGIGIAGSGTYHTAYTILNEVASKNHRSWMSIFYSAGYPLGMLSLALLAYLIPNWRHLQVALSVPAVILIYHCFFLIESPRWLLNNNRIKEAYKIVFDEKLKTDESSLTPTESTHMFAQDKNKMQNRVVTSVKEIFKVFKFLYGPLKIRKRAVICHFLWFSASLSYYAIALNAENFSANRYIYVAITGIVEIPSYIIPIIFLRHIGRKLTSQILFGIAGLSLLLLLPIPQDSQIAIITVAMIGRLCISSVYAVVILFTSDLFPTVIRASAIGTSSTFSHMGSISAPYIVDLLGVVAWYIPTTICAASALLSVLLLFMLPETKEKELTDRIEEEK